MGKTKFETITLENIEDDTTITGELVIESSNAYQLAVKGKVRSYLKTEWLPKPTPGTFSDIFEGMFGGGLGGKG